MAALNKIASTSPSRQHPSETETSIANALFDLESNIPDMKSALRPLQFVSARETQKRPHSRTLTAVHDALLHDVVYPVEIVGKRTRTREDGSKVLKVILDEKERGGVDWRLDTYAEVYRKLTGKGVGFEFPMGGPAEY
ncbi:MAG: hypothetical protein LQ342_001099 [Letrouitia transgressa]|nr:MAG: hypothetical protein LQ342_001099 [Letrouitia transgressa]